MVKIDDLDFTEEEITQNTRQLLARRVAPVKSIAVKDHLGTLYAQNCHQLVVVQCDMTIVVN